MEGATLVFAIVMLVLLLGLDVGMLVSMIRPGDERKQLMVWKASSYTLLGITGGKVLDIVYNFVNAQPMTSNPVVDLSTAATIYFVALLYYKLRHGG